MPHSQQIYDQITAKINHFMAHQPTAFAKRNRAAYWLIDSIATTLSHDDLAIDEHGSILDPQTGEVLLISDTIK